MFFRKKSANEDEIIQLLRGLRHPASNRALGEMGLVEGAVLKNGEARFIIALDRDSQNDAAALRNLTEKAVRKLPGVKNARAIFTANAQGAPPGKPPGEFRAAGLGEIIAVLSGKGGVGKSTVAANLACALSQSGLRVGLLDADIYGPSVPRLFGLHGKPKTENNKLTPLEKHGVKVMSIGFIVEEDAPVIWRGPMVQKALRQMIEEVNWGTLDALVADMPPGTGDVQLSLMQSTPLSGAVVVSTPQELALTDARKAVAMLRRLNKPVLGIIENMSGFVCPHCGEKSDIFGAGGAREEARRGGDDYLGDIPLTPVLRETSDAGTPLVVAQPHHAAAQAFRDFAARVWLKLAARRKQ